MRVYEAICTNCGSYAVLYDLCRVCNSQQIAYKQELDNASPDNSSQSEQQRDASSNQFNPKPNHGSTGDELRPTEM